MADTFGGKFYPNGINEERARSKDTLWLKITPRKLIMTNINTRTDHVADDDSAKLDPLWFLMPMTQMLTYQHTWDDLITPAAALKTITSKIQKQYDILKSTAEVGGFSVGHKADNPHLYTGSTRRSFNIQFEFSVYTDTYNDVFLPIQNLVEYSCAEISGKYTEFTFPYVFNLQTFTGKSKSVDIISIKTVALTSVQPSYKGPWIDGYPSSATVDLGFVDMNPLYRGTLISERDKKITVRSKSQFDR